MRSIGLKVSVLVVLTALAHDAAAAQTQSVLSEADRTIGDNRHKLDLVQGQSRIALSCRTTRPTVYAAAVMFGPDQNWPSGPIALELTRSNGSTYKLIFNGSLDLLAAEGSAARELLSWEMAQDTLTLRVDGTVPGLPARSLAPPGTPTPPSDGAAASFDLRRPQVASALARFKKLCQS